MAGLVFSGYPGAPKSVRQLQASSSLFFEVFRKYDSGNRLLRQAEQEVLAQADMRRSLHPTHSCAAVGPLAAHLTEAHHLAPSVFGTGSPWQRFAELPQGKVLGLGITMGPVTFYHRLEDELGAAFPEPVWLERTYRLPCRDADGRRVEVPVQHYAHRTDLPCGSTIGPITATLLGIRTVDVGNPMLSMHSAREMAGANDPELMVRALHRFLLCDDPFPG